jgi:hypothetical protein
MAKQNSEQLKADRAAIRWGITGHPFASVRTDAAGGVNLSGEYGSFDSARRLCNASERLYQRVGKTWKPVAFTPIGR